MTIAEMFLARAEWWFLEGSPALEDIFWNETETLNNVSARMGIPKDMDPDHNMKWSEVLELHGWCDLFMWAIEGGTLDE